ncbi:hypothetical protein ABXV22_22990 [Vibrio rotiferianus]|uniref:hypothetical protein n=1 Tax=Vibrio rotiferianus TaxID=190895 RepID=UPI003398D4B7
MSFLATLATELVTNVLSDEKTRNDLIQGGKNMFSSIFDEDENGELSESELDNYLYAEACDVAMLGHVATINDETSQFIEDYAMGLIDGKFEDEGTFTRKFLDNNSLSSRKLKKILSDSFDQPDALEDIAAFSEHFELEEHYYRMATRLVMFNAVERDEPNELELTFLSDIAKVFGISRLETGSINRELLAEAEQWKKDHE